MKNHGPQVKNDIIGIFIIYLLEIIEGQKFSDKIIMLPWAYPTSAGAKKMARDSSASF